jgi:TatD DNase family protein
MPFIDIHTHHLPANTTDLFIRNIFPSDEVTNLPPGGFYSVGLHPWYISNNHDHKSQFSDLEQKASLQEVIAVGECGLDKLANTEAQLQLQVFIQQCEIAEQLNKPVIIHCVKSYNEISHLKRKIKPNVPWIIHGYSGNEMITQQLVSLGFYFSLGKLLLSDQSQILKVFDLIPADRLFFETDECINPIQDLYIHYAEMKNITLEKLSEQIMWNFRQVFIRQ